MRKLIIISILWFGQARSMDLMHDGQANKSLPQLHQVSVEELRQTALELDKLQLTFEGLKDSPLLAQSAGYMQTLLNQVNASLYNLKRRMSQDKRN